MIICCYLWGARYYFYILCISFIRANNHDSALARHSDLPGARDDESTGHIEGGVTGARDDELTGHIEG